MLPPAFGKEMLWIITRDNIVIARKIKRRDCSRLFEKTRGLKSQWDESTLALALVIQDYRPFNTSIGLFRRTTEKKYMNGSFQCANGHFVCANGF